MKMVKSLLLGSAAGLVAVAGAQAADLPVKAKPVEYVKICTLYGEGFYYIPGSDTCLKLGGYVRGDYGWNVANTTPAYSGTQGAQDRTVSQFSMRHRANIQLDSRTQTEYGTLRTFTSLHFDNVNNTNTETLARAFIQWAGFTIGHAQSFQDTWAINDSYHYGQQQNNSDTSANGINQIAYTWELGNGATLTVGADQARRKSLPNLSNLATIRVGQEPLSQFAGEKWPDAHIDFKINQAWGYWATSFVAHDVSATYYNCNGGGSGTNTFLPTTPCGHPGDKVGWAIQTGAEFKLDFINPGDRFGFNARYAVGASGYGGGTNLSSPALFGSGNQVALGWMTDGIFVGGGCVAVVNPGSQGTTCGASAIELTTTWTVGAAYEHYWTPALKTSFSGAYTSVEHNATAKGFYAANVCPAAGFAGATVSGGGQGGFNNGNSPVGTAPISGVGTLTSNCDPNWAFFQGGVRTQWSPVRGFLLGLDVFYTRVFTAFENTTANLQGINLGASSGNVTVLEPVSGARPNGLYSVKDQGIVSAVVRAQRNFNAGD